MFENMIRHDTLYVKGAVIVLYVWRSLSASGVEVLFTLSPYVVAMFQCIQSRLPGLRVLTDGKSIKEMRGNNTTDVSFHVLQLAGRILLLGRPLEISGKINFVVGTGRSPQRALRDRRCVRVSADLQE